MVRVFLLLCVCLPTAALAEGIVGLWRLDRAALAGQPNGALVGDRTLLARPDGTVTLTAEHGRVEGRWARDAKGAYQLTINGKTKPLLTMDERLIIKGRDVALVFQRAGGVAPPTAWTAAFGGVWRLDVGATVAADPEAGRQTATAQKGLVITFGAGIFETVQGGVTQHGSFLVDTVEPSTARIRIWRGLTAPTERLTLRLVDGRLHASDGTRRVVLRR